MNLHSKEKVQKKLHFILFLTAATMNFFIKCVNLQTRISPDEVTKSQINHVHPGIMCILEKSNKPSALSQPISNRFLVSIISKNCGKCICTHWGHTGFKYTKASQTSWSASLTSRNFFQRVPQQEEEPIRTKDNKAFERLKTDNSAGTDGQKLIVTAYRGANQKEGYDRR
uniref:Uncharacterized protein n=1 Tax=Megaselia scalaris TaxID=36166 RepID=T1GGQ3_MEGSC